MQRVIISGVARFNIRQIIMAALFELNEGPWIMITNISNFFFDLKFIDVKHEVDFVAKISAGLTDCKSLFATLRQLLKFPTYFGNNWDALYDCLRD